MPRVVLAQGECCSCLALDVVSQYPCRRVPLGTVKLFRTMALGRAFSKKKLSASRPLTYNTTNYEPPARGISLCAARRPPLAPSGRPSTGSPCWGVAFVSSPPPRRVMRKAP
ncbi:hypothetical protein MRX96_053548 [Rhipicephalus microplus]